MEIRCGNDKVRGDARPTVDFPVGIDIPDATEKYGELAVRKYYYEGIRIAISSTGRVVLDKGGTIAEAKAAMLSFDPRSGRSVRAATMGEAMTLIARERLTGAQLADIFGWFERNPGVGEEAIKEYIKHLKARKVPESTT